MIIHSGFCKIFYNLNHSGQYFKISPLLKLIKVINRVFIKVNRSPKVPRLKTLFRWVGVNSGQTFIMARFPVLVKVWRVANRRSYKNKVWQSYETELTSYRNKKRNRLCLRNKMIKILLSQSKVFTGCFVKKHKNARQRVVSHFI